MNNKINNIFNKRRISLEDCKYIDNYYSTNIYKIENFLDNKIISLQNDLHNRTSSCYKKRKIIKQKIDLITKKYNLKNDYYLLLHGSFSTGIVTNFSDIDLILFVNFSNYQLVDYKELHNLIYDLNKFIYNFDPLAHHGVELFNIEILRNYDETILPINTLEQSTLLNTPKNSELSVYVNFNLSKKNSIIKLNEQIKNIIKLKKNYINYSPYRLKSIISVFLLICVLKIQAEENIFIYKKESIEYLIKKNTPNIKTLNYVSQIRTDWKIKFTSKIIRLIFNYLLPIIPSLLIGQKINSIIYNPFLFFRNREIFNKIYNSIKKYEKY